MEPSYWRQRWKDGRIGFHEGKPNTHLEKHLARLGPPGRVFVPLCGKAEDLAFLAAHGHEVVGVELELDALHDFFREHGITPEESNDGRFTRLRHEGITLLAGDFFSLTKDDLAGVTAAYDRAAIIALPPDMRTRYAARMRELLAPGTPILTVTFDYDQSRYAGPPFAVLEDELRRHYAGATIELLEADALPPAIDPISIANVGAVEKSWLIGL